MRSNSRGRRPLGLSGGVAARHFGRHCGALPAPLAGVRPAAAGRGAATEPAGKGAGGELSLDPLRTWKLVTKGKERQQQTGAEFCKLAPRLRSRNACPEDGRPRSRRVPRGDDPSPPRRAVKVPRDGNSAGAARAGRSAGRRAAGPARGSCHGAECCTERGRSATRGKSRGGCSLLFACLTRRTSACRSVARPGSGCSAAMWLCLGSRPSWRWDFCDTLPAVPCKHFYKVPVFCN